MNEDQAPVLAASACTGLAYSSATRHRLLTRVALLENILFHWRAHLGSRKPFKSGSSGRQTNEVQLEKGFALAA